MPELPEVETVRMQLEAFVVGETISSVVLKTPSILHGDISVLTHQSIIGARRFSKLLVLDTTTSYSVAIHLKMTGRLIFESLKERDNVRKNWEYDYSTNLHTHLIISFVSGSRLYFNDYRRFGTIDIVPTDQLLFLPYIKNLGKEFFATLTKDEFAKALSSTARAIKIVLLDQSKVGGVGNIYANEALWRSCICPEIPAKQLSRPQSDRLFTELELVMTEAKSHGGASSDNFRDLFGRKGHAQEYFAVYGKESSPCPRCETVIEKYVLGGRGTYWCPQCQKKEYTEPHQSSLL